MELKDDAPWQLLLRFSDQPGMVILYRTGKYILRGGSTHRSLNEAYNRFTNLFVEKGIINSSNQVSHRIQNIVFLNHYNIEIDLNQVAVKLGMSKIEYEPEQFPALIYRPKEYELVILLFSSGKSIITGTTSKDEAEQAVADLYNQIEVLRME